jgi:hypothetical protein
VDPVQILRDVRASTVSLLSPFFGFQYRSGKIVGTTRATTERNEVMLASFSCGKHSPCGKSNSTTLSQM